MASVSAPSSNSQCASGGCKAARVAIISTKNEVGIAEYPDSDKVGVWAGDKHYMLRRSDHLDYWDGER